MTLHTILTFDLETVPDADLGRRAFKLEGTDAEVRKAMLARQLEKSGGKSDFLKPHLHQIVAIGVLLKTPDGLRMGCLGTPETPEADLVAEFFSLVDDKKPTLVSWNGGGFDLPVLCYRALKHGVPGKRFWASDGDAKWNQYPKRYDAAHTDVMDVLAFYQGGSAASLHEAANLLGLPGKLDMDGSSVMDAMESGRHQEVRSYCLQDVTQTYMLYLRLLVMQGRLTLAGYEAEAEAVKQYLRDHPSNEAMSSLLRAWEGR